MSDDTPLARIVLCVPGEWEDRSAFLERLIHGTGGEYMFLGRILMHVPTSHMFELEFDARDERMARAFAAAGPHWRDTPEMARIDSHRSVVYLLGHGGSEVNVRALMAAGRAVLDAGGLGVKVDSSGLAHGPAAWREFCDAPHLPGMYGAYGAFVVIVTSPGEAVSCGMHTFGMHDVRVVEDDEPGASRVADTFARYLLGERPVIHAGQTFSCGADSPAYRITVDDGVDYGPESLFTNPYGTWRLARR